VIREKLLQHDIGWDVKFRWRGHEISRVEGLSDAVFAPLSGLTYMLTAVLLATHGVIMGKPRGKLERQFMVTDEG
jgi:hypothetical protein